MTLAANLIQFTLEILNNMNNFLGCKNKFKSKINLY